MVTKQIEIFDVGRLQQVSQARISAGIMKRAGIAPRSSSVR